MADTLKGKIGVVTGAASGIGLATTQLLVEAGVKVVMVDRDRDKLEELSNRFGDQAVVQVTDLLDPASCDAMVPEILDKVGHIDILHCNAGSYIGGDLLDTDSQSIDRMLNLNVNAVMKNVRAVVPHMKERGSGDIMVTCSVAGHAAVDREPVYASSKWAINCFVQVMRRQLRHDDIRVGQVSPGPVTTALLNDWPQDQLEQIKKEKALMEPEEVAESVMFMLQRPRHVSVRDVIIVPTTLDM
jgi:ribitol 2-dehydrogenase